MFTLKITVLAYFIQKKNQGPHLHQSITPDPLIGLQLPPYHQLQKNKKTNAPILFLFFSIIPR